MDKRKLNIANKSCFAGAFIDEGKLGLTGSDKTYILGDKLELILKMLNFKISDIICHFTKYRQDFLEKEVYSFLPDIRKLKIKNIDELQFYKLIGLTNDEIKLFYNNPDNEDLDEKPKKKNKNIQKNDSEDEKPKKKNKK